MKEYIEKSKVEGMLWTVIMSKDERTIEEILEYAPTIQAIPIPDNATNGDMIKALFPNAKTWEVTRDDFQCTYISSKDICGIVALPLSWWNAPYKKEVEE